MLKKFLLTVVICIAPALLSFALSDSSKKKESTFLALPKKQLQGPLLASQGLEGKVVLLDFWASWCAPCKLALPHYDELFKKYKDQGLVVIGINAGDSAKDREQFLKSAGLTFPIFEDGEPKLVEKMDVQALPTLFLFDKSGKVVLSYRGFEDKDAKSLETKILETLKN